MELNLIRIHQIGQEIGLLNASIENYIDRISRHFRQADKDTQISDVAFCVGGECAYIMQRLETLRKLSNELNSAKQTGAGGTMGQGGSGGVA